MIFPNDIPGFFGDESLLKSPDHVIADYLFETTVDPKMAAASLCAEQSTAAWINSSGEDLRPLYAAKVASLKILGESAKPQYSLEWIKGERFTLCEARIAHPIIHFGDSLPNLLSAVEGEGTRYCPGITTIRLLDLQFPEKLLKKFEGPQFGVEGLRKILGVHGRPFFIGVVKPNLGLDPLESAARAFKAWMGGIDMAKDDEMLSNPSYSPFSERMKEMGKARARAEKESKRPKMMIANLTGEAADLIPRYKLAVDSGVNAVMVNTFHAGFPVLRELRRRSAVPIMGHFSGMALYDRMPLFGIEGSVLVKLQRLAGCDLIGLPGFGERMHNSDEAVRKNIRACLEPMGSVLPALPIPGGSNTGETVPLVFKKIGHADFGFISGRGVFSHPDGPGAGAQSLIKAWEAVGEVVSTP